ncbi:hypothetical protein LJR219_001815 [Phenylobacterium sp. LjRoot219]|uniref:GH39 family glycosyl hydrolase n=1 Tax=Phenylobacterium sp. LjRoot219 TaxID=3342283 RepID=UPI003ECFF55A
MTLKGAKPGQSVKVSYGDQERGSPYPTWRALGSPQYPTREQLAKIRAAAELPPPEVRKLGKAGELGAGVAGGRRGAERAGLRPARSEKVATGFAA